MRKPRLYLDTTIPNYAFNDHVPDKQSVAQALFRQIKENYFEAFIFEVVIRELTLTSEPRQRSIFSYVKSLVILKLTKECDELASKYVLEGIIPESKINDARHIALASIYELDILVSYNFEHIVRLKTIDGVTAVNLLSGIKTPRILIPEEVLLDV